MPLLKWCMAIAIFLTTAIEEFYMYMNILSFKILSNLKKKRERDAETTKVKTKEIFEIAPFDTHN